MLDVDDDNDNDNDNNTVNNSKLAQVKNNNLPTFIMSAETTDTKNRNGKGDGKKYNECVKCLLTTFVRFSIDLMNVTGKENDTNPNDE